MAEILAPVMLATLVLVLLAGFPVAFSLAAVAGAFGAAGIASGNFSAAFLLNMPLRVLGTFYNDNLLAIPLLVFMGMILERTGIAEDMLVALNRLFGRLPGGLAYTTLIVGAVLSSITGFVSASVIAIGLIALPVMLRSGYDHKLSAGVVAAAGTLAQILPPSLVLIVLAEQLEVSLIEIYRSALLPSALLIMFYCGYVFVITWRTPSLAPPASHLFLIGQKATSLSESAIGALAPLAVILIVLSSIYFGVVTPAEGGAVGVTAALVIGLARRRLSGRRLREAMDAAGILCSSVIFLLLGASFFTLVFRGLDGHQWIEGLFRHVPAGQIGFLLFINAAIFILAFFLDFFEIAFIVLPLIAPIARSTGIDMVWLTVLLAVNLQTSFMHPPFGIALYNLRSVAPRAITTPQIYWGAVPFILIQILMVAVLILFPDIASRKSSAILNIDNIQIEVDTPPYYDLIEEPESQLADGPP
jgi:tripartite ATP-independent transporter DctM subunit